MKVAIYLRVSTVDQATKNNSREGFSIPAQREACRRKAKDLKATVIKEYADRGESARSADRPGLQLLLTDLCKDKNIDYVVVHKLDRLARNLHDDVMIGLAIKKGGAQLVSVTENIDETPSGRLLHGIMATIAEFYSRNLALEALKGATQKAKQGGTPFQAPIGYINVTQRVNRREVHTVAPDPERSSLVRWAFERYATGDYSEMHLLDELSRRGLRSRVRARSAVAPISHSGLNKMLSNRYYMGYVTYCGVEYKGSHQPLVTPALFAAVQAVRRSRKVLADKHRAYYHYLSRLIICGKCQRRLCFAVAKNRYHYFFCLNRVRGHCVQPYIPVRLIERKITKTLTELKFSEADQQKLTKEISKELTSEKQFAASEVKSQDQRLNRIQIEQENLLQAHYDKLISPELLSNEQRRLTKEISLAKAVLTEAEDRLKIITERSEKALELTIGLDLGLAFTKANTEIRRHLCQALFSGVVVDDAVSVQRTKFGLRRDHQVSILEIKWHDPINIRHLTEAIMALSLERETQNTAVVD